MIEIDHSTSSRWVRDKHGLGFYICEQCKQRALYENQSESPLEDPLCIVKLSEYCPRCGRHMTTEEEDT